MTVLLLQVYKERQRYRKEWRKRKRMVRAPGLALEVTITREVSVQNDPVGSALCCYCPSEGALFLARPPTCVMQSLKDTPRARNSSL